MSRKPELRGLRAYIAAIDLLGWPLMLISLLKLGALYLISRKRTLVKKPALPWSVPIAT